MFCRGSDALWKTRRGPRRVIGKVGIWLVWDCEPRVSSDILSTDFKGDEWGGALDSSSFPKCQRCKTGDLVPLSDFGSQGAAIHYKAWVCTNPECGFNLKIRNGDLYLDEPIASGAIHSPRSR